MQAIIDNITTIGKRKSVWKTAFKFAQKILVSTIFLAPPPYWPLWINNPFIHSRKGTQRLNIGNANIEKETTDIDEELINNLIVERNAARASKNWARADEIRNEFVAMNIELLDTKEGTTWKVK